MLDLFSIFSKGGLVLVWYIQNGTQNATTAVNSLVKSIVLEDKGPSGRFNFDKMSLQYHMDKQFSLVYVVGYQAVLELSFLDKFLTEIALEFRDKYKNQLEIGSFLNDYSAIHAHVDSIYNKIKNESFSRPKIEMKSYYDSYKASKSITSMTVGDNNKKINNKVEKSGKINKKGDQLIESESPKSLPISENSCEPVEETMRDKAAKMFKQKNKKLKNGTAKKLSSPADSPLLETTKKPKEKTKWDKPATGDAAKALDFSKNNENIQTNLSIEDTLSKEDLNILRNLRGKMGAELKDIDTISSNDEESDENNEEIEEISSKFLNGTTAEKTGKSSGGILNAFRSWVGVPGGVITQESLDPILVKVKNHLIGKNVAMDVAEQLTQAVGQSLMGQSLGTFERITSRVNQAMQDACRRLLRCGGRKADVLRDVVEAKRNNRPYVIAFCGVNGVGKSTNLAKITFWLIQQGYRVLIAACDTFRSGAVEQLRVHVQKLNYINPTDSNNGQPMAHLYEQGYGKDAAAVALSAINFARDNRYDVVMIDTSGRMQDNEPLMRSLAKLINVNQPDLVLFVGEALVGNEALDQLTKFNKALQDYSQSDKPRTINGIVLTKFDTVDDKVGAAISMTYVLGQPILFVGTGQTYADLRQLSPESVVKSLMK